MCSSDLRAARTFAARASPRATLQLVRAAKVRAASEGRHYVLPDDIKALALPVWSHRLVLDPEAEFSGVTAEGVVRRVLEDTPAPQARAA